jgi:tetratricopeptide (TPR) repeat protein
MVRIHFVRGVLFLSLTLSHALILSLATPGFLHASEMPAVTLAGTIFADGTSVRIGHAGASLCDADGSLLQESPVNNDGAFSFQGLQRGHYILKVQAIGFESVELHIDLSFTSQRGLSVLLKPARVAKQPHSEGETISAHELAMPEASRDLLASGKKKLYTEKNAQAALRDFQSAMQKAPNFYEAYYQAGMAYLSLQNPAEAEKHFRNSVDLSQKRYADADIALGALLLHRGEEHQGETLLREGLASNPHSWPGQFALGELELTRGHVEPALAAADRAAALAPNQPVVYRLLAVIHLRQRNYPALVTDLDAYLQLDPDSPAGLRAKELRSQAEKQLVNAPGTAVSANK